MLQSVFDDPANGHSDVILRACCWRFDVRDDERPRGLGKRIVPGRPGAVLRIRGGLARPPGQRTGPCRPLAPRHSAPAGGRPRCVRSPSRACPKETPSRDRGSRWNGDPRSEIAPGAGGDPADGRANRGARGKESSVTDHCSGGSLHSSTTVDDVAGGGSIRSTPVWCTSPAPQD